MGIFWGLNKLDLFRWTKLQFHYGLWYLLYIFSAVTTATTFKYVEGGLDHKAQEVIWNTSSIHILKCM